MCKYSIFFIKNGKLEFSLVPLLFCTEDYYKRVLYSVMCDVIVLKLTTDPLQAPGDISTGVDEVRQNLNPFQLLFICCPTHAMPQTLLITNDCYFPHQVCTAFKSNSKDF